LENKGYKKKLKMGNKTLLQSNTPVLTAIPEKQRLAPSHAII